jgi:hypothetical protein
MAASVSPAFLHFDVGDADLKEFRAHLGIAELRIKADSGQTSVHGEMDESWTAKMILNVVLEHKVYGLHADKLGSKSGIGQSKTRGETGWRPTNFGPAASHGGKGRQMAGANHAESPADTGLAR